MDSSSGGKLAQLSCVYPPYGGGIGVVAARLAALFPAMESLTPRYPRRAAPQGEGVIAVPVRAAVGNAAAMKGLSARLEGATSLVFHYPFFGAVLPVLRWKKKNPAANLVLWYHHDAVAGDWRRFVFAAYRRFLLPRLIRAADAVICSTEDYARRSQLGAALDAEGAWNKFHEVSFWTDGAAAPAHLPFGGCRDVLFVASLDRAHDFKGLCQLLSAWKRLPASASLTVVGEGPDKEWYRAQAWGTVRFVSAPTDADLAREYARHKFLIVNAQHAAEAFSLVAMEAQAHGTPVIAPDLPGVRAVAAASGLAFKPRDERALSAALAKALGMEEAKWNSLSAAVRADASSRFAPERAKEKLVAVLFK